jgi:hypothetical protein
VDNAGTYYAKATGKNARGRTARQTTRKLRLTGSGVICLGRLGS